MSKTPLPSLFGRFTAIQSDHRDIGVTLGLLARMCAALEQSDGARDEELAPVLLLDRLRVHLAEHFQAEEGEAYFGAIVCERPALREQIQALGAEHASMLSEVSSFCIIASEPARVDLLPALVRRFLAGFRAHERGETRLVQAFLRGEDG